MCKTHAANSNMYLYNQWITAVSHLAIVIWNRKRNDHLSQCSFVIKTIHHVIFNSIIWIWTLSENVHLQISKQPSHRNQVHWNLTQFWYQRECWSVFDKCPISALYESWSCIAKINSTIADYLTRGHIQTSWWHRSVALWEVLQRKVLWLFQWPHTRIKAHITTPLWGKSTFDR